MDGMRGLRPSMIFTVADGAAKHPCGYLNNNHPILAIEHKRRYAHLRTPFDSPVLGLGGLMDLVGNL